MSDVQIGKLVYSVAINQASLTAVKEQIAAAFSSLTLNLDGVGGGGSGGNAFSGLSARIKDLNNQFKLGLVDAGAYGAQMSDLQAKALGLYQSEELTAKEAKALSDAMVTAAKGLEQTSNIANPLKNTISELRNQIGGLLGAIRAGNTEGVAVQLAALREQAVNLAKTVPTVSEEFRLLNSAAGSAQGGLNRLEQAALKQAQYLNQLRAEYAASGEAAQQAALKQALYANALQNTNIAKTIQEAKAQVGAIRDTFVVTGGDAQALATRLRALAAEFLKNSEAQGLSAVQMRGWTMAAAQAERAAAAMSGQVARLGLASQVKLGMSELGMAASMMGGNFGMAAMNASMLVGGVGRVAGSAGPVGLALAGVGAAALGAGVALTGAANVAGDYQRALAGIRSITRDSDANIQALGRSMQQLSTQIPVSSSTLLEMGQNAALLGVQGSQNIAYFVEQVAKLGVVTRDGNARLGDLGALSKEVAIFLNETGATAATYSQSLKGVVSALAAVDQVTPGTIQTTLNLARYMAAGSVTLGLTRDQIIGISGALSGLGARAEAGGSSLIRVLTQMELAAGQSRDKFSQLIPALNLTASELADINQGLVPAKLQAFANFAGMTAAQFRELVNTNPAQAFLALADGIAAARARGMDMSRILDELGIKNIRDIRLIDQMVVGNQNLRIAIEAAAKAKSDTALLDSRLAIATQNYKDDLERLRNSWNNLVTYIGEKVLPTFDNIVKSLIWFVNNLPQVGQLLERVGISAGIMAAAFLGARVKSDLLTASLGRAGLAAVLNALIGFFANAGAAAVAFGSKLFTATGLVNGLKGALVTLSGIQVPAALGFGVLGAAGVGAYMAGQYAIDTMNLTTDTVERSGKAADQYIQKANQARKAGQELQASLYFALAQAAQAPDDAAFQAAMGRVKELQKQVQALNNAYTRARREPASPPPETAAGGGGETLNAALAQARRLFAAQQQALKAGDAAGYAAATEALKAFTAASSKNDAQAELHRRALEAVSATYREQQKEIRATTTTLEQNNRQNDTLRTGIANLINTYKGYLQTGSLTNQQATAFQNSLNTLERQARQTKGGIDEQTRSLLAQAEALRGAVGETNRLTDLYNNTKGLKLPQVEAIYTGLQQGGDTAGTARIKPLLDKLEQTQRDLADKYRQTVEGITNNLQYATAQSLSKSLDTLKDKYSEVARDIVTGKLLPATGKLLQNDIRQAAEEVRRQFNSVVTEASQKSAETLAGKAGDSLAKSVGRQMEQVLDEADLKTAEGVSRAIGKLTDLANSTAQLGPVAGKALELVEAKIESLAQTAGNLADQEWNRAIARNAEAERLLKEAETRRKQALAQDSSDNQAAARSYLSDTLPKLFDLGSVGGRAEALKNLQAIADEFDRMGEAGQKAAELIYAEMDRLNALKPDGVRDFTALIERLKAGLPDRATGDELKALAQSLPTAELQKFAAILETLPGAGREFAAVVTELSSRTDAFKDSLAPLNQTLDAFDAGGLEVRVNELKALFTNPPDFTAFSDPIQALNESLASADNSLFSIFDDIEQTLARTTDPAAIARLEALRNLLTQIAALRGGFSNPFGGNGPGEGGAYSAPSKAQEDYRAGERSDANPPGSPPPPALKKGEPSALEQITQAFEKLGQAVLEVTSSLSKLVSANNKALQDQVNGATTVQNSLVGIGTKIADFLKSGAGLESLPDLFLGLIPSLTGMLEPFKEALQPILAPLLTTFGSLLQAAKPLAEGIATLLTAFQPLIQAIVQGLAPVFQALGDILKAITPILTQIFQLLAPFIALFGQIVGAVLQALAPLIQIVGAILTPIFRILGAVLQPVIEVVKALFNAIAAIVRVLTFGLVNLGQIGGGTNLNNAPVGTPSTPSTGSSGGSIVYSATANVTFNITSASFKDQAFQNEASTWTTNLVLRLLKNLNLINAVPSTVAV